MIAQPAGLRKIRFERDWTGKVVVSEIELALAHEGHATIVDREVEVWLQSYRW